MQAQRAPVGIAVLGCGYWGVNYVRLLSELSEARVIAICDQRQERLEEIGARFPGIRLTTQLDEILHDGAVDAVVICTEARTHFAVTSRCLAAGKHVLVEKPITTTTDDAEQLIDLAERQRMTLMVGHTFLYNPGVRKVKSYIDDAEIGQIYYLHARRTNLGPIRRDVNALWDLAPHDISIFNYFLDSAPEWVSAVGAKVLRCGQEDVGFMTLGYRNGVIGHIHVSWVEPNKVREVVVVGSKQRIVFNDLDVAERVRVFEKGISTVQPEAENYGEYHFHMRDGDIVSPQVAVGEPLKQQCLHFIECLTHGLRPLTSGHEGRDVVRVMTAIEQSITRDGARVEVQ